MTKFLEEPKNCSDKQQSKIYLKIYTIQRAYHHTALNDFQKLSNPFRIVFS